MQRRIDDLEDLVKKLIAEGQVGLPQIVANQHNPVASNTSGVASIADTSSTVIDGVHSVYKVADDWHNVLQEVCCFLFPAIFFYFVFECDFRLIQNQINKLKQTWSQTQDDQNDHGPLSYTEADGSSLLFGQVRQIEIGEILATLPLKLEVDKLLCQFFDSTSFPVSVPRKSC